MIARAASALKPQAGSFGFSCTNHPGMNGSDRFDAEVVALASRLAATPRAGRPIVVYGSSTVRLWTSIAADLGRDDVIAVGFGGARLADLTRHCERLVTPLAPRRLVVAAGANDLEEPGTTPADIRCT